MTKQERINPTLRNRIDDAWGVVRELLDHDLDKLPTAHLTRAYGHLQQAWFYFDGQECLPMDKHLANCAEANAFDEAVANAPEGKIIEAFGKKWKVSGSPGSAIRTAQSQTEDDVA